MSKEILLDKINKWRRERTLSHETGEAHPLPLEVEEGLVEPQYPSWFPREPHKPQGVGEEIIFPDKLQRPVDLTPYEANQVMHWNQRRRARRINDTGKR